MILKRFYDDKLAQASYMIGCPATGEALVVDANRSVEQYVQAARQERLRITHVTETHIHADFVSGSRELAARTGARLYLSAEGGSDWQYGFAEDDDAVLLRNGDEFMVGDVRIDVMHTPGHTPEHLTFLVTDTAAADRPIGALTGDFLFVGDVGRPDLLEKAAGVADSMDAAARDLFRSLDRFRSQPDWLQVWPGHGAGSACGKGLSSIPHSTIGYERMTNRAFATLDEDEFVREVLAGQPEAPRYFAEMKRINRDGPPLLEERQPEHLDEARLRELLEQGAFVVDTRRAKDYERAFIPGTINVPLNRSFTTWAGWLVPYDQPFHLIIDESALSEALRALSMIGLDSVAGWTDTGALLTWEREGQAGSMNLLSPDELQEKASAGDITVIDVRGRGEWEHAHLPGAPNIPLGYLEEHIDELRAERPVVVYCQSGARSAIGASLLRAHGIQSVENLRGGIQAWIEGGNPVARGEESTDPRAAWRPQPVTT